MAAAAKARVKAMRFIRGVPEKWCGSFSQEACASTAIA
jgi:hypothetical protein